LVGVKICSNCGNPGEFGPNKAQPDGLDHYCRPCRRAYAKGLRARRTQEQRERQRAHNREWGRNQDPANRRRWNRYNKQRRRGVCLDAEAIEYAKIIEQDPCGYCGQQGGTIDHIVSVKDGGTSSWDNLSGSCPSCNSSKNKDPLLIFLGRSA